jgi:hypothetical protein
MMLTFFADVEAPMARMFMQSSWRHGSRLLLSSSTTHKHVSKELVSFAAKNSSLSAVDVGVVHVESLRVVASCSLSNTDEIVVSLELVLLALGLRDTGILQICRFTKEPMKLPTVHRE